MVELCVTVEDSILLLHDFVQECTTEVGGGSPVGTQDFLRNNLDF